MARKFWILAKAAICLVLILVAWNLFWTFKVSLPLIDHTSNPGFAISTQAVQFQDLKILTPLKQSYTAALTVTVQHDVIHIAVVVCGSRSNETLVMMKSAMIFSKCNISFIVFCDSEASDRIKSVVSSWPTSLKDRLKLKVRHIMFPPEHAEEWKLLFKPCASQRLFLPSLLGDIDSLLYMDTDTLFLTSPTYVWEHFKKMNQLQIAAVAPEHEDYSTGWYNRFARHPYYGTLGINSGVMLMNLTRMRAFGWENYVVPIYQEYKSKITWGDQDIINIVFHYHPEKLYVYPCNHNYRPDHCMYMSVCKPAEEDGIFVLHGNRGTFHTEKQPTFKAIYTAIEEHDFSDDLNDLLAKMRLNLLKTSNTNCGKLLDPFTKATEKLVRNLTSSV